MRRFACLIFAVLLTCQVWSQNGLEKMQQQKAEIERQIAASQKLLKTTDNDIRSQLSTLNALTQRLNERRKMLEATRQEIRALDIQAHKLVDELKKLHDEYDECRDRYAAACQFYQKQKSSFNPLLFVFSAKDYRQLSRRFRYVREYSKSITGLAAEIAEKQALVEAKKAEIEAVRVEKLAMSEEQAAQEEEARKDEQKQRKLLSQLQSKKSAIKKEIDSQQKQMNALNKEIDRQIALALKEAREKKKSDGKASSGNGNGSGASSSGQMKQQQDEDIALNGSFESNKGRLPVPITGSYLVVGNFGIQNVAGMKNVKMNNLGIDIQGEKGAQARVVFDGTVSTVFQQGKGQIGVLVRHGTYISVYCNLSDSKVVKGDKVKAGDTIGGIAPDSSGRTILHFQLHKEADKLNPSLWLKL